jgi:hypothetical protein
VSALARGASFALRALDPCAPLGVLECARWTLSERALDGLCLLGVLGYALVAALSAALSAMMRAVRRVRCPPLPTADPARYWPSVPPAKTYLVRRVYKRARGSANVEH